MQVYERVFALIKEKGITQKEFSIRTGIPQSTISDWKGKHVNPASDKIMIICDVLGVTPYDILSGVESNKYEPVDYIVINKNSEEYVLIEQMRELSDSGRERLRGYLGALKDMEKK